MLCCCLHFKQESGGMRGKITVIAFHRAKPGEEQALHEALLAGVPTLKEKGCINYDLHESPSLPGVFVFLENWESKADFDAHIASPHIAAFRAHAPDLLAEPADITLWREIEGN
jgi:quinol monooxygenase YgiN